MTRDATACTGRNGYVLSGSVFWKIWGAVAGAACRNIPQLIYHLAQDVICPPGGEERDDRYCRRSAAPPPSQTPDLLISTETEPKSGPEVRFPGRRNPMESCDRRDNWSPTPNHTNAAERDPAGNQRIRFAFGPKAVPRQVQSKQRGTHRPATPQTSVPTSGPWSPSSG